MRSKVNSKKKNQSGAILIEYALLIVMITVFSISATRELGRVTADMLYFSFPGSHGLAMSLGGGTETNGEGDS